MKMTARLRKILKGVSATFLAIALCGALVCAQARRAVVLGADGKYFRARVAWAGAGLLVALRAPALFGDRAKALESDDAGSVPGVTLLKSVTLIEFLPDPVDAGKDDDAPVGEAVNHFGQFTVNAAGNMGTLVIWAQDGAAYGTIRFPGWGRGVAEPLKGLALSGRSIRFVRSASTQEELRYVGAGAAYVQEYYGEYRAGGNEILGFYTVQGQRKQWEAYRAR